MIVAASVTAGLVASQLQFGLLDTLVGLGIAFLILRSSIELLIDLVRSMGEKADLARFGIPLTERFERFHQNHLRDWMLYQVVTGGAETREDLVSKAQEASDYSRYPLLRELGLEGVHIDMGTIEALIEELFERGWIMGGERLTVTDEGKAYMKRRLRPERVHLSREFVDKI